MTEVKLENQVLILIISYLLFDNLEDSYSTFHQLKRQYIKIHNQIV